MSVSRLTRSKPLRVAVAENGGLLREALVLMLMAAGRSNAGIAREVLLSGKAVEKHVAAIFTKLELPTDAASHHRRVPAVLTYLRVRDQINH